MGVQERLGVYLTVPEMMPVATVANLLDLLEGRLAARPGRAA
jgi:hypothetical protein